MIFDITITIYEYYCNININAYMNLNKKSTIILLITTLTRQS